MYLNMASELTLDSIVDGPGLRIVLWTQGCPHHCKGCHNPQTHNYNDGFLVETKKIIKEIENCKLQRGVTISGGEPFSQVDALLEIVTAVKENTKLDIWIYSGYTIEELTSLGNEKKHLNIELLKYVDVLVDGKFEENKKSVELLFKGSSNQRIIDVKKSFSENKLIEWKAETYDNEVLCI